jgi:hypothetical protein
MREGTEDPIPDAFDERKYNSLSTPNMAQKAPGDKPKPTQYRTVEEFAVAKNLPIVLLEELGWTDLRGGGIKIPYWDKDSSRLFARTRDVPGRDERFKQEAGKGLRLYGLWKVDEACRAGRVFITEGESDCVTLWHHKIPALGLPGNAAHSINLEDLAAIDKVYLVPDRDEGGEQILNRVVARLADLNYAGRVWVVRLPDDCKDVSKLHQADPQRFPAVWEDLVWEAQEVVLKRLRHPGETAKKPAADTPPPPWPEIVPLAAHCLAEPFPLDVLPEHLQEYVRDCAATLSCPPDYVAVPVVILAGGLIGASRALTIKEGHTQRPIFYAASVGRPGSGKSPGLEKARAPIRKKEDEWNATWKEKMGAYKVAMAAHEQQVRQAAKAKDDLPEEPRKPVLERLTVGGVTVEVLGLILSENSRGVTMVRDELTGWIGDMNAYRGGKGSDREFYLSAWSGTGDAVDRKKDHDDGPLTLSDPNLNVIGGMVPDNLRSLRGDRGDQEGKNDGFFDRVLFCWPEDVPAVGETWAELAPETALIWELVTVNMLRLAMQPVVKDSKAVGYRPYYVRLTPEGRQAWQEFTETHAAEQNDPAFPNHLRGPWAKLKAYCARFALVLHYLRWACNELPAEEVAAYSNVESEDMRRAARLVAYFKVQARKVHNEIDADQSSAVGQRLLAWIEQSGLTRFTRRDAFRAGRGRGCTRTADIDTPLELLEAHGYVRPSPGEPVISAGRKPGQCFDVNPEFRLEPSAESTSVATPEDDLDLD